MFISRLLPRVASIVSSRIALKEGARAMTYAELCAKASRLARAFRDRGVTTGDRVALLGDPGIDLVIAEHAAVALGAVPLAIYSTLAPPEIQEIIDDAAPAVMVFDRALERVAERLVYAARPLEVSCAPRHTRCISLHEMIERSEPLWPWHEAAAGDVALLVYTGGTSGRPKGVMHTSAGVSSWSGMNHPLGPAYAPDQRSIVFNLAHLSGQANLWKTVAAGGTLVFLPHYPPTGEDIVDLMESERITSIATVVGTFSDIVNARSIERRDLRSLRHVAVGGSSTSPHLLQRAVDVLSTAMILVVYSLTESGQLVSALAANDAVKSGRLNRLRSVGVPRRSLFGQEPFSLRIVDESGRSVPAGTAGEILLAGPQVMAGYWNNEEATGRTLVNGWLHTEDIGRIDADGYLYLLDRKREIIIARNGVNVYPSEVEDVVARHPAVAAVCIVGRAGYDAAEEIAAAVVLRDGNSLTLSELREFCAGRIASFKLPSALAILESLPRTGANKVDRARLRHRVMAADSNTVRLP